MLFPKRIPVLKQELIPARDRQFSYHPGNHLGTWLKLGIWSILLKSPRLFIQLVRDWNIAVFFFGIRNITLRSLCLCVTMGRDKPWQINAMIKPDALHDTDRVQLELRTSCSPLGVRKVLSVWSCDCQFLGFLYILCVFLCVQPSHGDKTSNPEVLKWMNALAKGRKQLKGV